MRKGEEPPLGARFGFRQALGVPLRLGAARLLTLYTRADVGIPPFFLKTFSLFGGTQQGLYFGGALYSLAAKRRSLGTNLFFLFGTGQFSPKNGIFSHLKVSPKLINPGSLNF